MSDQAQENGKPNNLPLDMATIQSILAGNHQLQGQVRFLEERLRELAPKLPEAKYPSTDMPAEPVIPQPPAPPAPRQNGEGVVEVMPNPTQSLVTPPPEGRMRIMIGVPMLAVSYEFFESFLKFWTQLLSLPGRNYEISYHFAYRKPVHMAEEYLVKTAMHNKCTHILLMDDDIFDVTPADLQKLIDAKKDMISGVMHASKFPHAMCVFRRYDTSKRVIDMPADTSMYRLYEVPALCPKCYASQTHWDIRFCPACGEALDLAIQPCDLVPFPFTLIDLKVFEKIKEPWFHCTNGYPTDSWFCDRMLEAGLQPYAHMLVRLNHAGVTDETKPHFMQMGMAKMNRNKAVVQISPSQMDIHQALLVNRMMEVEKSVKPRPPVHLDGKIVANDYPKDKDLTLVTAEGR